MDRDTEDFFPPPPPPPPQLGDGDGDGDEHVTDTEQSAPLAAPVVDTEGGMIFPPPPPKTANDVVMERTATSRDGEDGISHESVAAGSVQSDDSPRQIRKEEEQGMIEKMKKSDRETASEEEIVAAAGAVPEKFEKKKKATEEHDDDDDIMTEKSKSLEISRHVQPSMPRRLSTARQTIAVSSASSVVSEGGIHVADTNCCSSGVKNRPRDSLIGQQPSKPTPRLRRLSTAVASFFGVASSPKPDNELELTEV